MSFVFKHVPSVTLDVDIDVPGSKVASRIHVEYRLRSVTEQQDVFENKSKKNVTDDELMQSDILNITGIKSESGATIDFTSELLGQLMDVVYIRKPLVTGWMRAQSGAVGETQKNL